MPLFEEKENNVEMEKSIGEYLLVFFFDNYYQKISMVIIKILFFRLDL
jgi:hypothetical protein